MVYIEENRNMVRLKEGCQSAGGFGAAVGCLQDKINVVHYKPHPFCVCTQHHNVHLYHDIAFIVPPPSIQTHDKEQKENIQH